MSGPRPQPLTPCRVELLRALHRLDRPSLRELVADRGTTSTNGVSEHLARLTQGGFVHTSRQARSYVLTALGREVAMGTERDCTGRGSARCA